MLKSGRQFIRYERHTIKEISYIPQEFLNETAEEKKIGKSYTKILNAIENGEIDYQSLGLKM